jgi:hypothetical protein
MCRHEALRIAGRSGLVWHSGGGLWLAALESVSGAFTVFTDGTVATYASRAEFESGSAPVRHWRRAPR